VIGRARHGADKRKIAAPVPGVVRDRHVVEVNGVLPITMTCSTALSRSVEPVRVSPAAALEKITVLPTGPLLPQKLVAVEDERAVVVELEGGGVLARALAAAGEPKVVDGDGAWRGAAGC
jgi:hypothetical protein